MITARESTPRFSHGQVAPAALMRASLDSVAAIGVLLASIVAHGAAFSGAYLILALLVFSLTFPGSPPGSTSLGG